MRLPKRWKKLKQIDMTALYILLAILALLLALMFVRIRLSVSYVDRLSIILGVGFLRFNITDFTEKAKQKTPKKKKAKKAPEKKKPKKDEKEKQEKQKKFSPTDGLKLIKDVLGEVVKRFFKYLRVDKYDINIKVATGDAATTAVLYGAVSGALYSLTSILGTLKPRRKKGVYRAGVIPDFAGDKHSFSAHITVSLLVWQALVCAVMGGTGFVKFYTKKSIKEQEKEDADSLENVI